MNGPSMASPFGRLAEMLDEASTLTRRAAVLADRVVNATDLALEGIHTVSAVGKAASIVDGFVQDTKPIVAEAAWVALVNEYARPAHEVLQAVEPTIHEVRTAVADAVLSLAPLRNFLALISPVMSARREDLMTFISQMERCGELIVSLRRKYVSSPVPPRLSDHVELMTVQLARALEGVVRAAEPLQPIEELTIELDRLKPVFQFAERISPRFYEAVGALSPTRQVLRGLEPMFKKAAIVYNQYSRLAEGEIMQEIDKAGYSLTTLRCSGEDFGRTVSAVAALLSDPVRTLETRLRAEIPKVPFYSTLRQTRELNGALSRALAPTGPLFMTFEALAWQGGEAA